MGNGINVIKQQYKTSFTDDHILVRTEYDQRFGDITVYKNKSTDSLVLAKEKVFESEDDFQRYLKDSKLRLVIKGDNICPIVNFDEKSINDWCTSFYKVDLAYEFSDLSLDKLLREMKASNPKRQVWFTQDEAIVFLENIVNILKIFGTYGYIHGDIQPCSTFVCENKYNKEKSLKVLDMYLLNDFETGYQRCLSDPDYHTPLSPTALASLSLRDVRGDYNKPKNDVFAAGITIQSAIYNEDYLKYYDWSRYSINKDIIRNRLANLLKFGYNSKFVKIQARMLEFSDIDRYSINELYKTYEQIKDLFKRHSSTRLTTNNYSLMYEENRNNTTINEEKDFQYVKKNLEKKPNSTRETYDPKFFSEQKLDRTNMGRKSNMIADRYQKMEQAAHNEFRSQGSHNEFNYYENKDNSFVQHTTVNRINDQKVNAKINYRDIYAKESSMTQFNTKSMYSKENLNRGFMYQSDMDMTRNFGQPKN